MAAFFLKMKALLTKCKEDTSLLLTPDLNFFRDFLNEGIEVPVDDGGDRESEWLDQFKTSTTTILHPDSGKIIVELKFLPDGSESKYLTYFTERQLIGWGGSGYVYSCKSILDGQSYALKVMRIDKDFDKMLREIRAISALKHPHIVQYYQSWVESEMHLSDYKGEGEYETGGMILNEDETEDEITGPCLYMLMENCSRSLAKMIDDTMESRWSRIRLVRLIREILTAVNFIHENGYLHGDIATVNIFLDDADHAKVGDFGQARQIGEEGHVKMSDADAIAVYKAPELQKGCIVGNKIDIFSLGVVFGELLHPFYTASERIQVLTAFKESNAFPSQWVNEDQHVLRKMTSFEAADRPSAAELLADFDEYFPVQVEEYM